MVLPLLGPSVPLMSIALGFAAVSYVTVPRSGDSATTSYLPSLSVSLMTAVASFGNVLPPSSAEVASQVPSIADSPRLGSSASARQGSANSTTAGIRTKRFIGILRQGRDERGESARKSTPDPP